ncbi:ubiquinone anaerobic biosynthesis accessory factor UbiT [Azospirillum rugosum]|uniref:Lipid carrier protein YhbT n=1 Tax=Azospirillum rugosum TaxID=416170 RepID=A0ABS4SDL4_9PROT|nr:SCP2 sterol-binding domain-containing protein [Azospirillum rugosum]MBP2290670.1 putative lipid carrier protein YhbT [Azospirillum rugosum]MDQ0525558.1 putative lipid carrier protein YhbT [Azospirillum rugosum]
METAVAALALRLARVAGPRLGNPVLDRLSQVFARRHPRAAEALAELPAATVLVDPTDLPSGLLLRLGPGGLRLRLCDAAATTADAMVRGRFGALLDLAEGRIDGDALFFRRDLTIAGDTALVVALRNALDGEDIDLLAEIDAAAGPIGRFGPKARQHAAQTAARVAETLSGLRSALLRPEARRLDALERRVARVESRVESREP